MSRWFRFYDATLDDPKVQCLSDKLFRTWVNVLCIASRNNGSLPSVADMSFLMRLSAKETYSRLGELRAAGLIDDDPETGAAPHNWNRRQFRSDGSTERVKRFRERSEAPKRNVSETVNGTGPDNRDRTDTERKKDPAPDGAIKSVPEKPDTMLYRRGKEILGPRLGGKIVKALIAHSGDLDDAGRKLKRISESADPPAYAATILRSYERPLAADDWIT